ncbi:hypothetical protein [Streptomyces sp. NPDC090036]
MADTAKRYDGRTGAVLRWQEGMFAPVVQPDPDGGEGDLRTPVGDGTAT